jgi:hypothetical protein
MRRIICYPILAAALLVLGLPTAGVAQRRDMLWEGTPIVVRFPDNFDSDRNRSGDQFQAFLDADLFSRGRTLARAGTPVYFMLTDVTAGARGNERSRVSLTLTGIKLDSSVVPVETNTHTISTAPNPNQRLTFTMRRSMAFDASVARPASEFSGNRPVPGFASSPSSPRSSDVGDIARRLNQRAQRMWDMAQRDDLRSQGGRAYADLYNVLNRFSMRARDFDAQALDMQRDSLRRPARVLLSQAEEIARLMQRVDAPPRFQEVWRRADEDVTQLSEALGLSYTPARELSRFDDRYPRDSAAGRGRFHWSGRVDGSDYIMLRGDQVTTRHLKWQALRDVGYNVTSPLPRRPITVHLNVLRGRGRVTIAEQPRVENDYTAVVLVDDEAAGDDIYEFELTW